MKLKIYIFTDDSRVVEIDAPTKAEAWKQASKVFDAVKSGSPVVDSNPGK